MKAGRREWTGLAVLSLTTLLMSLDVSVLYLALPQLSRDLGADATQQLWIMDIYSFMLAGFLVTMGNLGDRIGRRRLLLIGAGAFGVASVLAAYSTSPEMLIAMRAVLGVAGATLMPSSMALIRTMFKDPRQMGSAIGLWFSCFLGGMAVGPLVGGVLLEHFWWGSAFLLGVPFMVLLLALGPALLPEYRTPQSGPLDLVSVAMSLAAILPVIYGIKSLARDGFHLLPVVLIVAGAVVGIAFVQRQRELDSPLLDLRLFAGKTFSSMLAMMLLTGIVMAGISLMTSIYLQTVKGLSPLHAGLWLVPQNIAMIAGLMAGPALARRFRTSHLMAVGLLVAAGGCLMLTRLDASSSVTLLVGGLSLSAVGIALPMSLGNSLIMTSVPEEKAGSAAALNETGGEFGVALGVAVLGALGSAVYRATLPDLRSHGITGSAADQARESLNGAMEVSARIPAAADLVNAAKESFTTGLNAVAWAGVAAFIGIAVLALVSYRNVVSPVAGDATDPDAPESPAAPDAEPARA